MADGRTEKAGVAPPGGRPAPPTSAGQPASGDLRAQINRAYASSAPIVDDEPDAARTPPAGPVPETAARFAAAMAAVERQQATYAGERPGPAGRSTPQFAPQP